MSDSFAYLADAGWPIERLQWFIKNGVCMDEVAKNVQTLIERGMPVEEIIRLDCGGDDEPPQSEDKPPPPTSRKRTYPR